MRTPRISKHIVASIDGAIAACKRGDDTVLALLDEMDFETCLKDLQAMKDDGFEVVPSDKCDNQAYTGHCLGHKTWKEGGEV